MAGHAQHVVQMCAIFNHLKNEKSSKISGSFGTILIKTIDFCMMASIKLQSCSMQKRRRLRKIT